MMYLLPSAGTFKSIPEHFGVLTTPRGGGVWAGIKEGRPWALDNNAFTTGFNPKLFKEALERLSPYRSTCLFVTLPDVVGDAERTHNLYHENIDWISDYGFPIAFVAQDGQENMVFPPKFDVLFIGGTNRFKDSWRAMNCAKRAKSIGKMIHVGRVNGMRRLKAWFDIAATSDGTHVKFERDVNLPKLSDWINSLNGKEGHQIRMFKEWL